MNRQYYGIENLSLTGAQKNTLVSALMQLGANQHQNASRRNHWRVRLDGDAVIFEGEFNDSDWTTENMVQKVANIFNVNVSLVGASMAQSQYGQIITFSASGQDKFRMIAFGGLLAKHKISHKKVLQYLADNLEEWEEIEDE